MLNTVVFAVVLGVAITATNIVASIAVMKFMMNPKFIRGYVRKIKELASIIEEEMQEGGASDDCSEEFENRETKI